MEQVGVRQQEVLRRVVARNPHPTTVSLILQATPAGRGLTEADWLEIETSVRPVGLTDADWLAFWSNIRPRIGDTTRRTPRRKRATTPR